jgi:magnesium chelatase family protein
LPIGVGYLAASNQINVAGKKNLFCGELSLDGGLRHVNGILAIADMARKKNFEEIFVPAVDANEAALIDGIKVMPVENLKKLIEHFKGGPAITENKNKNIFDELMCEEEIDSSLDFSHIKGQEHAKRALELAATGGHNVLFSGTPGSGKTILARSFPSIMPRLDVEEALEITRIFSVSGLLPSDKSLLATRPFRSPHHSASSISLVGGGSYPRPGEVTLAHRGVLFLDEFPEFPRHALEALRQPMEDGYVTISRASGTMKFPANFTLIAAMNPCPCGHMNDPDKECICAPSQVSRYQRKISGPILDRIDIHVTVSRVKYEKLVAENSEENSAAIRERVEKAREIQRKRFKDTQTKLNSDMNNPQIKEFCELDTNSKQLMKTAVNQYGLSARSYFRILKVARTIADLAGSLNIEQEHLAEAIQYRVKNEN